MPCLVVLLSYGMVYINLAQASEDEDTSSQRRAVMILTISYLVFILPHSIFESLSEETANRALLSVIIHAWFWCVYVDNFFIYIIFWRRIRKAIQQICWRSQEWDVTGGVRIRRRRLMCGGVK